MHEMRAIATDVFLVWYVSSLSVTRLRPAKMAKRIEVLLGINILGAPKVILNEGPDPHTTRGEGIQWIRCGFCLMTLVTCGQYYW